MASPRRVFGASVVALAVLVAAFGSDALAATRYWSLDGVQTPAGASVTGSIGYDDVTNQVTSWWVRIGSGNGFLPFTYMPGNSTAVAGTFGTPTPAQYWIEITAVPDSAPAERYIQFSVVTPLNGAQPSVPLLGFDSSNGGYFSAECGGQFGCRGIASGSLVFVPFPPPVGLVDVVEFHHAGLDHYFITGDAAEVQVLDLGTIPGWTRTGQVFQAYAIGSSPGPVTNPVCRYFGVPVPGISSHFYSANAVECYQVYVLFGTVWQIESDNVFQIDVPDSVGACPGGTIPVYRLFNNQADANHRYTTSTTVRAQMEAAGWVREGYGPGGVVFCAFGP